MLEELDIFDSLADSFEPLLDLISLKSLTIKVDHWETIDEQTRVTLQQRLTKLNIRDY